MRGLPAGADGLYWCRLLCVSLPSVSVGEDLDIALVPTRVFRARLESLGGDAFAARWGDPVWRNDARITFYRHPATGEVTRVPLESVSSPDSVAALPLSGLDLRRADDGTADAESRRITH